MWDTCTCHGGTERRPNYPLKREGARAMLLSMASWEMMSSLATEEFTCTHSAWTHKSWVSPTFIIDINKGQVRRIRSNGCSILLLIADPNSRCTWFNEMGRTNTKVPWATYWSWNLEQAVVIAKRRRPDCVTSQCKGLLLPVWLVELGSRGYQLQVLTAGVFCIASWCQRFFSLSADESAELEQQRELTSRHWEALGCRFLKWGRRPWTFCVC